MSDLALQLIKKAKKENAKVLDLGKCGLTKLPKELFDLKELKARGGCPVLPGTGKRGRLPLRGQVAPGRQN